MDARTRRRRIATATVAALALAGLAFAAWTVDGRGTGSAKAGSSQPIQVTAGSPSGDLYPGGSGALELKLSNPNPFPVTVTRVTYPTPTGNVTSSNEAACPGANNLSFPASQTTGLAWSLPARATDVTKTVPNAVTLSTNAPTECQGVTFTVTNLTVGGASG